MQQREGFSARTLALSSAAAELGRVILRAGQSGSVRAALLGNVLAAAALVLLAVLVSWNTARLCRPGFVGNCCCAAFLFWYLWELVRTAAMIQQVCWEQFSSMAFFGLLPLLLWKGTVQGEEPDLVGGELLSGDGQVEQPVRRHPVEPQQGGQGLKVRLRDVVLIAGERFVVDAGEVHHLGLGQAPALPRQPQGVSEFFHSSDAPFAPILMQNRTIPLVILSKKENIIDFLKNRN